MAGCGVVLLRNYREQLAAPRLTVKTVLSVLRRQSHDFLVQEALVFFVFLTRPLLQVKTLKTLKTAAEVSSHSTGKSAELKARLPAPPRAALPDVEQEEVDEDEYDDEVEEPEQQLEDAVEQDD